MPKRTAAGIPKNAKWNGTLITTGHCAITTVENFSNPPSDLGWSHGDRRTVLRYSVLAVAELVETASTICIDGRMTEISRRGCYVNTPNTLPVNSFLKLFISHDERTFVTKGKVIYAHEGIGMGILFVDSTEDQLQILIPWLVQDSWHQQSR